MDRRGLLGDVERVVIKVGTSSITMGGSVPSQEFMDGVARQISELKSRGMEVLIVSSGAIGIGLRTMKAKPKPNEVPIKQAAASVGQGILMQKWNDAFQKYGIIVAQILITMDDYSDRDTVLNLNNTMTTLLKYGAVPIFNENDAISVKEIGPVFGDNDTLSAVIASRADADLLVILSDVAGLYDGDPKNDPDAKLISIVESIDEGIMKVAGGPGTKMGTGGMKTKINAAKICGDAGCRMIVASSSEQDIILRTVGGEDVGTLFLSDTVISKKRRWIKAASPNGAIIVDEGAGKAVLAHRSLLPVGVKYANGTFEAGEIVDIICGENVIARGVTDYGSEEINRIRGMRSDAAKAVLNGVMPHKDVVRSENLAIFP